MKTITRVISAAAMLVFTAIVCALAKNLPLFFFRYWEPASQWVLGVLGQAFGWIPFAVWEVLALLLIVWFIASLIRDILKLRVLRWASGVLWSVALGVCVFVLFWGVGHFGPTKTEQIIPCPPSTAAELRDAALWYGAQASADAQTVARDADGAILLPDFSVLSDEANAAFASLSTQYPVLPSAQAKVKPLFGGELFSYLGTTGLFVAYTSEPSFNPDTYAPSLPHTVCHELAHRLGAYAEEDANFLAFLACRASDDPAMRYSGSYSAFLYCYNALYDLDPDEAQAVRRTLSDQVNADLDGSVAHYDPYEGTLQNAAQSVNDTYLKAFDEAGIASYGLVSDALVAWYRLRNT